MLQYQVKFGESTDKQTLVIQHLIPFLMKKLTFFTLFLLTISIALLPVVFGSGPPPPLRALPEGAKMRIGQGRGVDFSFSPDGKRLAVACSIIGIWVHDAHTGKELALLTGHTDAVTSVVYSPNGATLASGSYDQTVRLWDANTFQHLATLTGHIGDTRALAFSPDGATLASGASRSSAIPRFNQFGNEVEKKEEIDRTIRLWDVATGKHKMTLTSHTGWITTLAFSPDGTLLASASTDGSVRLWDTVTGKHKITLNDHKFQVFSVVFSPDSKRLVSRGHDATVRLWDADTGEQKAIIEGCYHGAMTFSPDGSTLAISQGSDKVTISLWNTRSGVQKAELDGKLDGVLSAAFSPDGSKLVAAQDWQNTTFRWWDVNINEFAAVHNNKKQQGESQRKPHHAEIVRNTSGSSSLLEFSPDGATLASWNYYEIGLWNADTGDQIAKIRYPSQRAHRNGRPFVTYSEDGATFACGNGTKKIWLFDADTYKYRAVLDVYTDVRYRTVLPPAEFSPDGTTLAIAKRDKTLRLFDTRTGIQRATLTGHTDEVNTFAFSSDGTMLASGSADKTVLLWDVQTGEIIKTLVGHTDSVRKVEFSPDGETLASASKEILVWNALTGEKRYALEGPASIAFSPDGKMLVTGDEWKIHMWDTLTGKHKKTLSEHLDKSWLLAFSPDGTSFVSSGETVQLWDASTGKNLFTLSNKGGFSALAFSPDSKLLAGAKGSSIELWDVRLHQRIATLRGHNSSITSIAFSPKDGRITSASYDGTIVLWEPVNIVNKNIVAKIAPSSVESAAIGKQLTFNIEIAGAKNVAGYQLTLQFDEATLRYISSVNGDYLPDNAFFMKPIVKENQITLASTALTGMGSGDGTLATVTFEVVNANPSPLRITNLILSDAAGKRLRATVKNEEDTK